MEIISTAMIEPSEPITGLAANPAPVPPKSAMDGGPQKIGPISQVEMSKTALSCCWRVSPKVLTMSSTPLARFEKS